MTQIDTGEIRAALVHSKILNAEIWLSFVDDFEPRDGRAVFYAHELQELKSKSTRELREIHKLKKLQAERLKRLKHNDEAPQS